MNAPVPIKELRLHIGAHKTATTHIQNILSANRESLARVGIDYFPRDLVRNARLVKIVHNNYWQAQEIGKPSFSLEEILVLPVGHLGKILISEENIIGRSINMLEGLYPQIKRALLPWSAITDQHTTKIYLSIRSFADILPSAYSQVLRDGARVLPFDAYRDFWISSKPKWSHLIEEIRHVFPLSELKVWTFERYVEKSAEIINEVCGVGRLSSIDLEVPSETKTLSTSAVLKIGEIDPSIDGRRRRQAIDSIVRADKGGEKFCPLSSTQRRELNDQYLQDIEVIKNLRCIFLG